MFLPLTNTNGKIESSEIVGTIATQRPATKIQGCWYSGSCKQLRKKKNRKKRKK
jgi:uncharacterized protein YhbP (UPF0306 family)